MAREKTVFDSDMVAHIWAQQTQAHGRRSDGRFFFKGRALYSYGRHFVAGYIMPDRVALLNSDRYSISTARHQAMAAGAVSHLPHFAVPELTKLVRDVFSSDGVPDKKKLLEYLARNAKELDTEAGAYLLDLVRVNGSAAARMLRIKDRDAKERAKAAKAAASAERAGHLKVAKLYTGYLADRPFDTWLAIQDMSRAPAVALAKRLHLAHRAAKAAKYDRQAAAAHKVLKALRTRIKLLEAKEAAHNRNAWQRNNIAGIRTFLKALPGLFERGETANAWPLRQFGQACANVATLPLIGRFKPELAQKLIDMAADAELAYDSALVIERATKARKVAAELANWLAGMPGARCPSDAVYDASGRQQTLLRAVGVERDSDGTITEGTLETSRGAKVPLTHAVRVFRFLKLVRERGRPWERNGHTMRVGHFQVDRVAADGSFVAGCHNIGWPEVERVATMLGVFELPADDSALAESRHAA